MNPLHPEQTGLFTHWRSDLPASLVVFLVAFPLCMGIALASGAPVTTGLITGILGGLMVGAVGGSPLQVSGPAAGLTVICAEVIREHGVPVLGVVVLLAGVFQICAGMLRLGQWFRAVSPAVVHGMLSGIGLLILSSQLHVLVDDRPLGNGLANLAALPTVWQKCWEMPTAESVARRDAMAALLRRFGGLHERQNEIERAVERIVTRHGSRQLHEEEAAQLPPLVPKQQALIEDLLAAQQEFRASPLAAGGAGAGAETQAAIDTALAAAHTAELDLAERRLADAERAQAAVGEALRAVEETLESHRWAGKLGVLAVLSLVAWKMLSVGRMRMVPAPLVAVTLVTALAWLLSAPVLYVEVPDNLLDGLTFPAWTVFEDAPLRVLLAEALVMAVIASAETLLCANAVDKMHGGQRTKYDLELAAQGIGNITCGLFGALPMTGVMVRSAANVDAGAKTRLSTILHGLWLLLFVVALTPLLRMIPVSALAGVLVYVGFRLIDFSGFVHCWKESRAEAAIFLVTMLLIVAEDLLVGVLTGMGLSALKLLIGFSRLDVRLVSRTGSSAQPEYTVILVGAATFLRLPMLAGRLDELPAGSEVRVDANQLIYIDYACFETLLDWSKRHIASGGRAEVDWNQLHGRLRGDALQHAKLLDDHLQTAA